MRGRRPRAPGRQGPGALVLALAPYAQSHRAGKIARSYVPRTPTTFVALQAAGRSTPPGVAGEFEVDGLRVVHVRAGTPVDSVGVLTPWVNLVRTYLLGLLRLARTVLATPADVVHANGTVLLPLAILHRWRFGSVVVLEVDEKPGSAALPQSVGVLFRPLEPVVLRMFCRSVDTVVTVTQRHGELLEQGFRFRRQVVVRNAPENAVRGWFVEPPRVGSTDPVVFVVVSSIFEGRCFEAIVDAGALLQAAGAAVEIRIYGYARPAYRQALLDRVDQRGVAELVQFRGPIPLAEVAGAYARGHVALSLYQPELAHNDSLPNKVLEALSMGRPVLSTGQRDAESLLEQTGTGWPTGSTAEEIAASLLGLERGIRSGALDLPALARHCRHLGDTELTWEHEFSPVLDRVAPRPVSPTTDGQRATQHA